MRYANAHKTRMCTSRCRRFQALSKLWKSLESRESFGYAGGVAGAVFGVGKLVGSFGAFWSGQPVNSAKAQKIQLRLTKIFIVCLLQRPLVAAFRQFTGGTVLGGRFTTGSPPSGLSSALHSNVNW